VWLALGDPAGAREDAISAIWRFRDLCERRGVEPAFWRVGGEYLRVYADLGLTAVPLPDEGGQPRFLLLRAERDLARLDSLLPAELRQPAPVRSEAA
jgi:phosphatidylglycerol lysyltransferase